jgi:DNA-binding response OmpR family regulator
MMPKLSGFEVCRRLRADTAAAGADDFITKPINKTELLLRVRAMLESRSHASDVDRALAYMGRIQAGI